MRRLIGLLTGFTLAMIAAGSATPAVASGSHAQIQGSGSSWAANAVNQWIADVQSNGLQVVYTPNGSAQGRQDYASVTTDFGVSDIGYQGVDQATGASDTSQGRAYAYLPIVAGGTSFPYQLRVGGQLVRNLRLSGLTIAKIFTNQITNWDDAAITKDNNGRSFPNLPIVPVVHSEGAGESFQLTRYLNTVYPSIWSAFGGAHPTEYFPRQGRQVGENGSDGVMNFIDSGSANGAIGYDEYSYALGAGYPVAKLENSAGYFTLPNQYNVAVALTQAQINYDKNSTDYLLQTLDKVYTYTDSRTYPLSSYSYMIEPTSPTDTKMTTAKRQTIADYLNYAICIGQKEMGPIGYSPLPVNLVQAGFAQIAKLKAADPNVSLVSDTVTSCHNPTFDPTNLNLNKLAEIAPLPAACDKAGAGPCTGTTDSGLANPVGGSAPSNAPNSSNGSQGSGGGNVSTTGTTGTTGTRGTKTKVGTGNAGAGTNAGQSGLNPGAATNPDAVLAGASTVLPASQSASVDAVLAVLVGVLVLLMLTIPPVLSRQLTRRKTP